MAKFKLCFT